jgi:hypothetical protein
MHMETLDLAVVLHHLLVAPATDSGAMESTLLDRQTRVWSESFSA